MPARSRFSTRERRLTMADFPTPVCPTTPTTMSDADDLGPPLEDEGLLHAILKRFVVTAPADNREWIKKKHKKNQ